MNLRSEKFKIRLAIAILLALALFIRAWDFPHRNELRYLDEIPYCQGSLQLLEGMIPEYKYSPGGPQTWAGWIYAGAVSAWHVIHPGAEERAVSMELRPFVAVNHALWDAYADLSIVRCIWILIAWPVVLGAVISGFRIGHRQAGLAGGILTAALVAMLPIFVDLSNQGRPYMMAWALGIIAIDLAMVAQSARQWTVAAIVMGLSIASRIDMLMLLPIVWSEIWARRQRDGLVKPLIRYHGIVAVSTLVVAPWILTNLIGNLRIIATVRLSTPVTGPVPITDTLKDVAWNQGLGIALVLCLIGLIVRPADGSKRRWLRNVFVLLALASIFKATGFGLQHQGGPLVILIAFCAAGLVPLVGKRWHIACAVVAAGLVVPIFQCFRLVHRHHMDYVDEDAVAWIEQHVPPGTAVYTANWLQPVIPTTAASDRLWSEVNDNNAWQKKFTAGMQRFNLSAGQIPRALSDEDMIIERGNRRVWFILGSRPQVPRVRFDVNVIGAPGMVYDINDPVEAVVQHGGVLLWRQFQGVSFIPDTSALGPPIANWQSPSGKRVFICATNDVKAKLKP